METNIIPGSEMFKEAIASWAGKYYNQEIGQFIKKNVHKVDGLYLKLFKEEIIGVMPEDYIFLANWVLFDGDIEENIKRFDTEYFSFMYKKYMKEKYGK